MLTLHQYRPVWNLPNASPFCMKLETYLRMASIPYKTIIENDPLKAPKKLLPYINDNHRTIGDSTFIINYLQKKHGDILDAHLTPQQKATAFAIQHLCEDTLYWSMVYTRWIEPTGWIALKKAYFNDLPIVIGPIISRMVRKQTKKRLHAHGMGRHTPEEIHALGKNVLNALATLLGEQAYFLGDKPTTIDATCYAFLANISEPPIMSALKRHMVSLTNLMKYVERMTERFYHEK